MLPNISCIGDSCQLSTTKMADYIFYFNLTEPNLENGFEVSDVADYQATDILMKTYPPIFLFFGTVGNLLSAVIWYKQLGDSVTGVFVVAFTIANLVGLYLEPLLRSTYHWYQYDVRKTKDICKTVYILDAAAAYCSVWFLFAFCLERSARLLQINGNEKARKRAILFALFVALAAFGLTFHCIFTVKTDMIEEKSVSVFLTTSSLVCGVQKNTVFMSSKNFNFFWVQELLYCLLPSTLIAGCTMATGQMLHSHKRGNINPCFKHGIPITKADVELAKTAMCLGIMEIVCTVPITLFRTQVDVIQSGSEELVYTVLIMLIHADYTFKFFVYCALNECFRKSLAGLIKRGVLLRQLSVQGLRRLSTRRPKQVSIDINMELIEIDVHDSVASSTDEMDVDTSSEQPSSGRSYNSEKRFRFESIQERNETVEPVAGPSNIDQGISEV